MHQKINYKITCVSMVRFVVQKVKQKVNTVILYHLHIKKVLAQ